MKKFLALLLLLSAVAGVVMALKRAQQHAHRREPAVQDSDRADQETATGKDVVDEWGEESFPASDAAASW